MKFKNLRESVLNDIHRRFNNSIKETETEEGLKNILGYYGKEYKKNPREKIIKLIEKKRGQEMVNTLYEIGQVENSKDFSGELIITLEWTKSRTWGKNPRAYTNYGFSGGSISGCGYCKTSTATAESLNSHLPILKLLFAKKEEALKNPKKTYTEQNGLNGTSQGHINAEVLGYGSGYNILPKFEGGVGVSSHKRILEGLGLNMKTITSTGQTDVFLISKKKHGKN